MAVVSELIDVGLILKQQGKLKGAIEHFRQLHATYPGNARIMFELAACWSAFDVPEQAVPLYRELIARPKGKGLPAKDLPRLYTRLGAALYALQEYDEALSILDEGLRLHPSYRPCAPIASSRYTPLKCQVTPCMMRSSSCWSRLRLRDGIPLKIRFDISSKRCVTRMTKPA